MTLVSFGDGATNIGAFHEACNLASVWRLPVIFLCQNNGYGEHTAFAHHQRSERVADRAAAYAMPGVTVDGNDPLAVRTAPWPTAADRARAGEGPTLVEALTYRLYGHVFGDRMAYSRPTSSTRPGATSRSARFRRHLLETGALTDGHGPGHRRSARRLVAEHPGRGPHPAPAPAADELADRRGGRCS